MNRAAGPPRTLRQIRGEWRALARARGVDVDNPATYAAWSKTRHMALWGGAEDRLRCSCDGLRHTLITKLEI